MVEIVWIIIRKNNRFLLAQRAISDTAGGTWVFPGGKVDTIDETYIHAAVRELREEVGLKGEQFKKICILHLDKYIIKVLLCYDWKGKPKPSCEDIIGVGWFSLPEIHSLGKSLAPFTNNSLSYLSYLIQHYDNHPDEWKAG